MREECGSLAPCRIALVYFGFWFRPPMEAERVNALAASLADLSARLDDLRRYL